MQLSTISFYSTASECGYLLYNSNFQLLPTSGTSNFNVFSHNVNFEQRSIKFILFCWKVVRTLMLYQHLKLQLSPFCSLFTQTLSNVLKDLFEFSQYTVLSVLMCQTKKRSLHKPWKNSSNDNPSVKGSGRGCQTNNYASWQTNKNHFFRDIHAGNNKIRITSSTWLLGVTTDNQLA